MTSSLWLTIQLFVNVTTTRHREGANKLFKVDGAVFIAVKDVKDIIGKSRRIAKREELFINLLECALVKLARRTIFEETLVPSRRNGRERNRTERMVDGRLCIDSLPLLQFLLLDCTKPNMRKLESCRE